MSIEHITTKIKREAEEQAQAKRTQAQQRKAALEAEAKESQKTLQAAAAQTLEKKKQQRKAVRLSLAKQTQHIALQQTKRTALDAVLRDARQQLAAVPADQYVTTVTAYAQEQELQPDAIRSVVAPETRTAETEQVLAALGITAPVEHVADMTGGLVLHGDDYTVDLSFDRLFQDATPALEGVAAKVLFAAN